MPLVYSFKLEKNTKRKILKLNIFYLVEKIVRFHVDCRPQFSIVYLKSEGCSQWGPCIGINGRFAVCFSKLLVFFQYNISAQWRVADPTMHRNRIAHTTWADPVAFYTRRTTVSFGISGYVELVTLYCHAIFWGREGLGEGCVETMQIVSCLKLIVSFYS